MANDTLHNLDMGQFNVMWQFLMMGKQKSNIPVLKKYLDILRQAMIQKTAGQRKDEPKHRVDFNDLGTVINIIVCEAMCLYLSGDLDKLDKLNKGA